VNSRRSVRRLAGLVTHNWLLKLAAIVLATLLYAGFVASQDSATYPGPVVILPVNPPADTVITNQLRDVEEIRYIAPADLGRLRADDFRATVDLSNVEPTGEPVSMRVNMSAIDPRVTILDFRPRAIQVVLDESTTKVFKVTVVQGPPPAGLEIGDVTVEPAEVAVTGPSANVDRVATVRVNAPIDASGLDVDRNFRPEPLDAAGAIVSGVDLEPASVHVTIPVYTNKESRSLPVNPIVTGTPGAGFRISAVEVDPAAVTVEGDGEQLAGLASADTAPVSVSGATRNITATVALQLPPGVTTVGAQTVLVRVSVEPVTETRTFVAGVRLDGMRPDLVYEAQDLNTNLTLFGSTADLDTIAAAPLVVAVNVADLGPGTHLVTLVPSLPSGVTVAAISPETITVTVTEPPSPSPGASGAAPSEAPASPSPSPTS
jgi:YbbR domain-containing protein